MTNLIFAAEEAAASDSPLAALGVDARSLIFQLLTFVLVFLVLQRFAFKPISRLLAERRKTIDEGVRAGQELAKERAKLEKQYAETVKEARHEADKIVANAHKEAREVVREAEKTAARKADTIISDAEVKIGEETARAKKALEKDIVSLVSEATEALVGEKVDPKKDAALIDKILKGHLKA
ncbi:MAG: F0F1 ATP synthase subunit B [Candidatus Saccharibacteria bacterium]|nr:F0F1 ATP synthase subunit B [Candidatus Saccharibacteria bacterium]